MNNLEKWKAHIEKYNYNFALKKDGTPMLCVKNRCEECYFNHGDLYNCSANKTKWMQEEYIEAPTLTECERKFCELVDDSGFIARSQLGEIGYFLNKPIKVGCGWISLESEDFEDAIFLEMFFKNCKFSFISWDDEEPWSIEELLKLPVHL